MVFVTSTVISADPVSLEKELIEIYQRAYASMPAYAYTERSEIKHYIRWLRKRAGGGFLLARVESQVAGFIAVDDHWKTWCGENVGAVHELVVDPQYQGRGIGRQLLRKGIQFLQDRGVRRIELWVGEKNDKAHCFYRSEGFVDAGKWGKWVRMLKEIW
jgi:GNAT superfamily N-acetyltransferase